MVPQKNVIKLYNAPNIFSYTICIFYDHDIDIVKRHLDLDHLII